MNITPFGITILAAAQSFICVLAFSNHMTGKIILIELLVASLLFVLYGLKASLTQFPHIKTSFNKFFTLLRRLLRPVTAPFKSRPKPKAADEGKESVGNTGQAFDDQGAENKTSKTSGSDTAEPEGPAIRESSKDGVIRRSGKFFSQMVKRTLAACRLIESERVWAEQTTGATKKQKKLIKKCFSSNKNTVKIVEDVAGHIQSLLETTNPLESQIEDIASQTHSVSSTSAQLRETATRVGEMVDEGEKSAKSMESLRAEASKSMESTVNCMESLLKDLKIIEDSANMIGKLATQTNILSLNAQILAAHAGEAGVEFVVIADEMKRLAGLAKDSSEKSTERLTHVRENIASSEKELKSTASNLDGVTEKSQLLLQHIAQIKSAMTEQMAATASLSEGAVKTSETTDSIRDNYRLVNESLNFQKKYTGTAIKVAGKTITVLTKLKDECEIIAKNGIGYSWEQRGK